MAFGTKIPCLKEGARLKQIDIAVDIAEKLVVVARQTPLTGS